jgi:hypothetical protein
MSYTIENALHDLAAINLPNMAHDAQDVKSRKFTEQEIIQINNIWFELDTAVFSLLRGMESLNFVLSSFNQVEPDSRCIRSEENQKLAAFQGTVMQLVLALKSFQSDCVVVQLEGNQ